MGDAGRVARVAWALSDPVRLSVMQVLMGGPAVVAELVCATGASQSNVSNHLRVLRERDLVRCERLGRQAVYEIPDASVARLVESLTAVAGGVAAPVLASEPMAEARTCYDHLAGRLGVGIFGALVNADALAPTGEVRGDVTLGPAAGDVFGRMGVEPGLMVEEAGRRRFAFACPDWTERMPHLGGALGAAVCGRFFESGWVRRVDGSRAVELTDAGEDAVGEILGPEVGRAPGVGEKGSGFGR